MDNNYSAILQERRNILHLNNLYVLRRCMQVAILFKNSDMSAHVIHSRGLFRLAGKARDCAIAL